MTSEKVKCLYCQSVNAITKSHCDHCGMPLAKSHPESANTKIKMFKPIYIVIVIFAIIMMFYLPR
ncbi:DnrP protein [Thalassotalea profundi]|uniref:DnrP protein n=1 Tax=Thalassotalea profundi TaxID=2036687 RepID=A0ABQ3IHJ9_9GAMM|nr:DnrP protein [Thalassotalea profundi]GHE83882.1 hypothetical protein GCM10011501_10700 [Thalassotalea profundi]